MSTIVVAVTGGNWTSGTTWTLGTAPTAADDGVADLTSGNFAVDSGGAVCRSLDCTSGVGGAYTGVLTHNAGSTLTIGDATPGVGVVALKLNAGMTYTPSSATSSLITFFSTSATQQTIDYAGKTFSSITCSGAGSNYAFTSGITAAGNQSAFAHTRGAIHLDGTSDTSGLAHTVGTFSSTGANTRSVNLGNCTLNISGTTGTVLNLVATSLTWNSGASTIALTDTGASAKFIGGAGQTFNLLKIPSGSGGTRLTDSNTFSRITAEAGGKLALGASTVTTIAGASGSNNFNNGTNVLTISQVTSGATLKFSNQFAGDYLSLTNIVADASGITPAYAGTHSTDGGGNTGWVFTDPPGGASGGYSYGNVVSIIDGGQPYVVIG